ncbi:DUF6507 family protein [Microbacterium sp. RD1]|uniref:DUF6507 family protein n=1 Tax=Microbacterium sp. RD1 TaxID=3457313 RepID=UPI003FA56BB4
MSWSIDPDLARTVCTSTDEQAGQLDEVATSVANAFDGAQTAVDGIGETSAALGEVAADPFLIQLAGMRRMVSTVTQTTRAVIDYYDATDYAMAAQTQETMRGLEP